MNLDTSVVARQTELVSESAFEQLYRAYSSRVFSTAYRMLSSRPDAEDATQDVFVKVYRNLGSFRGESAVSTWIYRITVNTCLDMLRRRKQRRTEPLDETADTGSTPMNLGPLIESALPRLPSRCRQVFILHDIQGLKHQEIAKVLGITDGASKSQLHRARAFLRRELAPYIREYRWLGEV